jgi:hypothetical protein
VQREPVSGTAGATFAEGLRALAGSDGTEGAADDGAGSW